MTTAPKSWATYALGGKRLKMLRKVDSCRARWVTTAARRSNDTRPLRVSVATVPNFASSETYGLDHHLQVANQDRTTWQLDSAGLIDFGLYNIRRHDKSYEGQCDSKAYSRACILYISILVPICAPPDLRIIITVQGSEHYSLLLYTENAMPAQAKSVSF